MNAELNWRNSVVEKLHRYHRFVGDLLSGKTLGRTLACNRLINGLFLNVEDTKDTDDDRHAGLLSLNGERLAKMARIDDVY